MSNTETLFYGQQMLFDRTSTSNTEYIGTAASGTDTGAKEWQIKAITYDANAKPLTIKYAGGSADFAYAWDDRTTLQYS